MASTTDMNYLLYYREQRLIKERDELLRKLEVTYINYIQSLLTTKMFIAERIRAQYDELIKHNASIYVNINIPEIKHSREQYPLADNYDPPPQATPSSHISTEQKQRAINLRSIWESSDDDNNDPVVSISSECSLPSLPFIPHMSIQEASTLCVNDMIDHRDIVGCFIRATIVDKDGSNLNIHYPDWGNEWNLWCDYNEELYKFASYKSISERQSHRLLHLKEGDLVDINPIRHKGWKIGEVKELDADSGQVKIAYHLEEYCHYVWTHMDHKDEIEELHTFTQQNIDNTKQHKYQSVSFECIYCQYSCTNNNDLRIHVQNEHTKRPYLCKFCPFSASHKQATEVHQKQHVEEAQFKCTLCTKLFECNTSFVSKRGLTEHLRRVHKVTEEAKTSVCRDKKQMKIKKKRKRKYTCMYCDDVFINEEKLRQHIQNKHSEKKFLCTFCPQAFLANRWLELHKLQHTMKRKLVCAICEELYGCQTSFAAINHYSGHLRRVHKIEEKAKQSVSGCKRKQLSPITVTDITPKKMKLSQIIKGDNKKEESDDS